MPRHEQVSPDENPNPPALHIGGAAPIGAAPVGAAPVGAMPTLDVGARGAPPVAPTTTMPALGDTPAPAAVAPPPPPPAPPIGLQPSAPPRPAHPPARAAESPDDLPMPTMRPVPTAPPAASPPPAVSNDEGLQSILFALASFCVPGLGQMLNGQVVKGLVLLGASIVTCCGFGLVSVAAAVDAFMIAERKRRGEPVGEWQFF